MSLQAIHAERIALCKCLAKDKMVSVEMPVHKQEKMKPYFFWVWGKAFVLTTPYDRYLFLLETSVSRCPARDKKHLASTWTGMKRYAETNLMFVRCIMVKKMGLSAGYGIEYRTCPFIRASIS